MAKQKVYFCLDIETADGEETDAAVLAVGGSVVIKPGVVLETFCTSIIPNSVADHSFQQYAPNVPGNPWGATDSARECMSLKTWDQFWSKFPGVLTKLAANALPKRVAWAAIEKWIQGVYDKYDTETTKVVLVADCGDFDLGLINDSFKTFLDRSLSVRYSTSSGKRHSVMDFGDHTPADVWAKLKEMADAVTLHDHMPDHDSSNTALLACYLDMLYDHPTLGGRIDNVGSPQWNAVFGTCTGV